MINRWRHDPENGRGPPAPVDHSVRSVGFEIKALPFPQALIPLSFHLKDDSPGKDHPELLTPHKKPKGGELTPEQREENRHLAQQRIYVEHGIRRIKGWRIMREDYRLALGLFPMIAHAVVGMVQLNRIVG